jgi:Flp pilus assembly protein TadG
VAHRKVQAKEIDVSVRRLVRGLYLLFRGEDSCPAPNGRSRNPLRSEAGGSLVEFAITIPFMLSFIFGLMELCIACYTHELISEVAREATRYAIVHGATCITGSGSSCTASASSVNTYALATGLPNIGGGTLTPSTTYPDGGEAPGDRAQVKVTYLFPLYIPFVSKTTLTMSATSTMCIIQ